MNSIFNDFRDEVIKAIEEADYFKAMDSIDAAGKTAALRLRQLVDEIKRKKIKCNTD